MKTRIIATTALLILSGVALADRGPPGPPPGLFGIDKLEILLDLDAYQKAEVQKILDAQRTSMQAKREQMRSSETRPSFEEMQKQREASQQATRAQLQKILSEQQLKKFDVLTERPDRGPRHDRKRD